MSTMIRIIYKSVFVGMKVLRALYFVDSIMY